MARQLSGEHIDLLREVAADIRKMLSRILGEEVKFEVRLAEKPGNIHADPSQVEQILREAGYKVLSASGGTEALEIFRTHGSAISLLLTDVVMLVMPVPDASGSLIEDDFYVRNN